MMLFEGMSEVIFWYYCCSMFMGVFGGALLQAFRGVDVPGKR